jgi:hypothetical protein
MKFLKLSSETDTVATVATWMYDTKISSSIKVCAICDAEEGAGFSLAFYFWEALAFPQGGLCASPSRARDSGGDGGRSEARIRRAQL